MTMNFPTDMKRKDLVEGTRYNLGHGKHDNWFFERSRFVTANSLKRMEYGGKLKDCHPAYGAPIGVWVHYFGGGKDNRTGTAIVAQEHLRKVRPA